MFQGSFYLFILTALGLCCYMWAFSRCRGWRLLFSCRVGASHCGGFSCCRAQALGHAGSVVVTSGFSCFTACGIFPDQDQTCVPCIGRRVLNHRTTREVLRKPPFKVRGCFWPSWPPCFLQLKKRDGKFLILQCTLMLKRNPFPAQTESPLRSY